MHHSLQITIEWFVEVMCCVHLKIFTFVDMIYPLMAKILGHLTDHPDGSLGHPVDLKVAWATGQLVILYTEEKKTALSERSSWSMVRRLQEKSLM